MGDQPDFDEFVALRWTALVRSAYLLTGDWAAAEDLLQTALVRCWRRWSRLSGDPEPYVRKAMVNSYLSWRRRRWHGESPTQDLPETTSEDLTGAVDEQDALWRALSLLPRRQRAVIVLRYFDDRTEVETGRLLGISVGTVKSQTSKALRSLRVTPGLDAGVSKEEVRAHVADGAGPA